MEATTARSKGGKGGLPATPRLVLEAEPPFSPALPPTADAVRMQVEPSTGFDIGQRGKVMQDQDQTRSLSEMRCRRASGRETPCLGEKFLGETRTIVWQGSRHETAPRVSGHFTLLSPFGNPTRICEMDH